MVLVIFSNAFYSYGESLSASFLPELAQRDSLGTVSGWGWSFGYFGGMLALGICLGYVLWAQGQGLSGSAFCAGDDADHGGASTVWPRSPHSHLLTERAAATARSPARGWRSWQSEGLAGAPARDLP